MIYLKIINAIMKTKIQTIRIALWIILGVAALLTNMSLSRTPSLVQKTTTISATQTGTSVVTTNGQDEVGSTDGIMIMAVVIVLIVILPILLRRRSWQNGKRHKTAPPS
jgi:hypothetical protein